MILIFSLACVVLGNYFDYASTKIAFAHGAMEFNWVVRLLGLLPSKLLATALLSALATHAYWRGHHTAALSVGLTTLAIYGAVALWNLHVAGKF